MLGYIYKDLSHVEKLRRRHALDVLGRNTVLSQLTVLILAYIYRLLFCTRQRRGRTGFVRRLEWWLTKPLSWDSPGSRSIGDFMMGFGWFGWMFWLVMREAGDDYLHITKAFGMAGTASFPLHTLLSMKRTPLRYLFDVSYDGKTNYIHQGLGKIIYLFLNIHFALYLKFFWDTSRMKTRLLEFDTLCGVAGIISLNLLIMTSYPWVRQYFYRVFYIFHIIFSAILFPLLYLHVDHHRPYVLASSVLLFYDRVFRYFTAIQTTATIHHLSENILHLSIRLPKGSQAPAPASHLLLHIPGISTPFTKNPFTIADSSLRNIQVVSRIRNGFTKKLSELTAGAEDERLELPIILDLYYGTCTCYTDLPKQFDRIIIISGGVGGAFAVPWVKHLAHEGVLEMTKFIWVVRDIATVTWAINPVDTNRIQQKVVARKMELFITGIHPKNRDESGEGVEMQERLLGGHEQEQHDIISEVSKWGVSKDNVYFHRPDLEMVLENAVNGGKSVAVLVCGPWELGASVRRVVGKRILRGDKVWVHVEEFGS